MDVGTSVLPALIGGVVLGLSMGDAVAQDAPAAIENVLSAYEQALNAADTDAVMELYAEDGVFMPQHSLPLVGSAAVRGAYEAVFHAIDLDIAFEVVEIRQLAPDWAFARTLSDGVVTINATGETGPEANQELFLFRKGQDGAWRIARYIFSTTDPPRP